jgi:hypothetical protein
MSTFLKEHGYTPVTDDENNDVPVIKASKEGYYFLLGKRNKKLVYTKMSAKNIEILRSRYLIKHGKLKE